MSRELISKQFPLPLSFHEKFHFDSFVVGENQLSYRDLQRYTTLAATGGRCLLWGGHSTGKTHLLFGAYCLAAKEGLDAFYVPLRKHEELSPAILTNLDEKELLCIDDVDAIAKASAWQEALFNLYNRCTKTNLVFSSYNNPKNQDFVLADIKSRLLWGTVHHLHPLSDEKKVLVLKRRAKEKAMEISDETLQYMLRHGRRDLSDLLGLLDQMDVVSLAEKRRITIPFAKEIIAAGQEKTEQTPEE